MHFVAIDKGVTAIVAMQRHSMLRPQIRLKSSSARPTDDSGTPTSEVSVFFDHLHKHAKRESRTIP